MSMCRSLCATNDADEESSRVFLASVSSDLDKNKIILTIILDNSTERTYFRDETTRTLGFINLFINQICFTLGNIYIYKYTHIHV